MVNVVRLGMRARRVRRELDEAPGAEDNPFHGFEDLLANIQTMDLTEEDKVKIVRWSNKISKFLLGLRGIDRKILENHLG